MSAASTFHARVAGDPGGAGFSGGAGPRFKRAAYDGIEQGGWAITTRKEHITPARDIDAMMERICARAGVETNTALPEMLFGGNVLQFVHPASGFALAFRAEEALAGSLRARQQADAPAGADVSGDVLSEDSQLWKGKRHAVELSPIRGSDAFDWTFTTFYAGTPCFLPARGGADGAVLGAGIAAAAAAGGAAATVLRNCADRIDYTRLKDTTDPILWSDAVDLFEDDLHDCGLCAYSARVRVHAGFFYALATFWLRVDNVHVRTVECRVYHEFGWAHVLRERSLREDTVAGLAARGHPSDMASFKGEEVHLWRQWLPERAKETDKILLFPGAGSTSS